MFFLGVHVLAKEVRSPGAPNNLAEKIAAITDFKGEIIWDKSKPDGTPKKLLDINRIKKLGWEAKIDLDNGLKETISQLKNNDLDLYFSPNSQ